MEEVAYVVPPETGLSKSSDNPPGLKVVPPKRSTNPLAWVKSHKVQSIAGLAVAVIIVLSGYVAVTGQKVSVLGMQLNPLYQQANCDTTDSTDCIDFQPVEVVTPIPIVNNTVTNDSNDNGSGDGAESAATCLSPENIAQLVPVYRLWSQTKGDHFYTTDLNEKGNEYVSEGISGYVFKTPVAGTQPIYRSYKVSITSHYYSTVDDAPDYDYVNEGILGYSFSSNTPGSLPWNRLHMGYPVSDYLQTLNSQEKSELIAKGYIDQGIVAYLCEKNS